LRDPGEVSDWLKNHPDFFKEIRKRDRDLRKLYLSKKVKYPYSRSEEADFAASFIWNEILGKDGPHPEENA
jgi:hypothetical protein